MAPTRVALIYSNVAIVLGVVGYVVTGGATALIGSAIGLLCLICAIIAIAKEGLRKHAMHAFCVFLLMAAVPTTWRFLIAVGTDGKERVAAFLAINALLAWGTMVVMVRSFIAARKARQAAG